MTDRRTYPDRSIQNVIIRSQIPGMESQEFSFHQGNPQVPQYQDDEYGDKFYDQRPVRQITEENRNLRELIKRIEEKNQYQPEKKQYRQQGGSNLQNRIDFNARKINELTEIIDEQRNVIGTYRKQLEEFERNLLGIMKLDKDIHSKLVNPHTSSTLQKNVKNVLVALNSKAPYDKLIKMIENIKV